MGNIVQEILRDLGMLLDEREERGQARERGRWERREVNRRRSTKVRDLKREYWIVKERN